jgi:hypothetical protein
MLQTGPLSSQESSTPLPEIPFAERLRFYLNDQTQDVVKDLLAREQELLQLVQNIHLEVASRGVGSLQGFHQVYDHRDTLIQAYQQELVQLVGVYDDLQKLQHVADYRGDERLLGQVTQTKYDLLNSMDDRALYKKGVYTAEHVGGMVDEYTGELDSLLNIYDALERAKVLAQAQNNSDALQTIAQQQTQLVKILGTWNKLGPMADTSFLRLQNEARQVSRVMKQVDSLQTGGAATEAQRLEAIKSALLERVDKTVIDLLAKAGYTMNAYPTVSDFIDSWKKERLVDIQTRLTEYRIIQKQMLESATNEERDRMLNRDLTTLAGNYSDGRYRLAEFQIEHVRDQYASWYSYFTPLTYYQAECRYHRKAYDAARDLYRELAADSSAGTYRAAAFVRLMQYADVFGMQREFLTHYAALMQEKQATSAQRSLAHYLAANRFFGNNDLDASMASLRAIPSSSEYYMSSQLLLAIVYLNKNDFTPALPILQSLTDETSYPWTDLQTAYIRNTALLKLGMIYYQRAEFKTALSYFERVSQGFQDYDQALIGQSWANLRLGDYTSSLARSHQVLNNYLASNFTYEALTLSGHCKRLLNQPESALNAYRYVVRSQNERQSKEEINQERDRVQDQDRELNRLEKESLEKRQVELYSEIDKIKDQITGYMDVMNERTDTGVRLLQDYYDERLDIFARMDDLQTVIETAEREERPDLADKARKQLSRLIRVLETYRSDQEVVNTAFLVDFPLAAKEASMEYQKSNLSGVYRDLELEKRRLERNVELLTEYQRVGRDRGRESDRTDLSVLQSDLGHLRDRLSILRKSVVEAMPEDPSSNAELWNDFSGFGMTDVIYKERSNRLDTIDRYAARLKGIETVLADRRGEIQQRLQQFEDDIRKLQDDLLSRKIKLDQMERQTYFDKFYFDEKEQEEEAWEERLNRSSNP